MQTSIRISPLAAIALAIIPALILVASISATTTRGDDSAGGGSVRGNVDCDGGVNSIDVISLLSAITGSRGAPTNCIDWDGYTNHGCDPGPSPSPTACDFLYLDWVTTVPGASVLPARYDIDCNGDVNLQDVFALLYFTARVGPQPTEGCPIGFQP